VGGVAVVPDRAWIRPITRSTTSSRPCGDAKQYPATYRSINQRTFVEDLAAA
jgi:hypothetical protein